LKQGQFKQLLLARSLASHATAFSQQCSHVSHSGISICYSGQQRQPDQAPHPRRDAVEAIRHFH
jgi:hypothetical protein